ncbi:MAG TPA: TIGR02757 family protein [Chitinophagales bacterium]|nr:TIGR02757 family protein [Chitinophagales bacterium]MCB9074296.1 TIGR02757 family protein [Chitinophagales bacterium]HMU98623.1 TIGR02757 family protein [Chitinophagales bacterium]HMV02432.1 TIGR02757 family protein [Chitinophagales bacterium]HMW93607.1 TIGR02757 family protein [Chitinophagales bacterium]
MEWDNESLKLFLEEKVAQYNTLDFISDDPIQLPHQFTSKEDIEIIGFLVATIAWGNRKMIIKNGKKMLQLMGNAPYDFILSHNKKQLDRLDTFVHRTFNGVDFKYFIQSLRNIYTKHNGLESIFIQHQSDTSLLPAISAFHSIFFELSHEFRTEKHIANPEKGSVAKRINMFLRWMCRKDNCGVDFGIWAIHPSKLSCPLDVHSGNIARALGLITRKNNDLKALQELDATLRKFDPQDPVKYDFALFGLGVNNELDL